MMKTIKLIVCLFALCGLVSVIAMTFGYVPIKTEKAVIDYDGVKVIIQALSVVVLFCTVIYQVFNSNIIARNQNNIMLFDKRLEKYNILQHFIAKVISSANCTNDDIQDLKSGTGNLDLLFDDDIALYSNILVKKGFELKLANVKYEKLIRSNKSVDDIVEENHELLSWFSKQIENECREKFSKYLNMEH